MNLIPKQYRLLLYRFWIIAFALCFVFFLLLPIAQSGFDVFGYFGSGYFASLVISVVSLFIVYSIVFERRRPNFSQYEQRRPQPHLHDSDADIPATLETGICIICNKEKSLSEMAEIHSQKGLFYLCEEHISTDYSPL